MKLFNKTLKIKRYKNLYVFLNSLSNKEFEYILDLFENKEEATELMAICLCMYAQETNQEQFCISDDEKFFNELLYNLYFNMAIYLSYKKGFVKCEKIKKLRISKVFKYPVTVTKKGFEEKERIKKILSGNYDKNDNNYK